MHHSLTVEEIKLLKKGDELKVLSSYCLTYASDNDIVIYINTRKYERNDFYSIQCMNKKGEIFSWSSRRFALLGKEDPPIENSKRSNGMLRIIGERGTGRTTAAFAVAKAFNAIVIVPERGIAQIYEEAMGKGNICAAQDLELLLRGGRIGREVNIVSDGCSIGECDYLIDEFLGKGITLKLVAYTFTLGANFNLHLTQSL
jgi:hypothetical protein